MTLYQWPEDVISAVRRRDIVLVVGAGVSMNSVRAGARPPDWSTLLKELATAAGVEGDEKSALDSLIASGALLEAGELVQSVASVKARQRDVQSRLKELTDGRARAKFDPNDWHDAIMMIEPTVIVTTNYDCLIERASRSGYGVHSYDSESVGQEVRRGDPVLIKIHGTVDHLEKVILTQSDYSRLHLVGRHALDVVQALLLTRVALFVGYSMADPDITLLLQNTVGGRLQTPSHYILSQEVDSYRRRVLEQAFGVTPVEYPSGDHARGLELLRELGTLPPTA